MTLNWKILQWKKNSYYGETWQGFSPSVDKASWDGHVSAGIRTQPGRQHSRRAQRAIRTACAMRICLFWSAIIFFLLAFISNPQWKMSKHRRRLQILKREHSELPRQYIYSLFLFHPPTSTSGSGSSRTKNQCSRSMRIRVHNIAPHA